MFTAVRSARKKYEQHQEKVKENKKYQENNGPDLLKIKNEINKLQDQRKVSRMKQQIEEEEISLKIRRFEDSLNKK